MKTMTMKMKMNTQIEISYASACEIVAGTMAERDFENLNESTVETIGFEEIQNRKYFVTKIGKKGTKLYPGTEYETTADHGVYEVEVWYDYRHPSNFAQNVNNTCRKFTIEI